jgi:hypothetical protein
MKKKGSTKAKDSGEENGDENVQHAFCAYCVQISTTFLLSRRRLFDAFELDVGLDEFHGAIGAGGDGLGGSAGEPVDHRAAGDDAQQKRRVQDGEFVHVFVMPLVSAMMMEKIMVVAPTTAVPISTGLAVALKVLPAPSFSSSRSLGALEVYVDAKSFLSLLLDVGNGFDQRKLIDRLRVVGDRAVGIHRDGDRAHAQEAEGHQSKRKHRSGNHQVAQAHAG